jgi:MoaA/NifB/PqqE/SkfB family radical SAM enzyme
MTLVQIHEILNQADAVGTVEAIDFEGGEPFLYHPILCRGVEATAKRGYRVGLVTNAYWATSVEDAVEWLRPLAGWVHDISLSDDTYHGADGERPEVRNACIAAKNLGMPCDVIQVAQPNATTGEAIRGKLPPGEVRLMYRGRAAASLSESARKSPWDRFVECPYENLRDPSRVHVDPSGEVHVCQGISLGNIFRSPLHEICSGYEPDAHPIVGPLLRGGPAELASVHGVARSDCYADAWPLCFESRLQLRRKFPEILTPDQMYGVEGAR